ncbi:MAG: hypothetical protein RBR59_00110 [Sulfurimonadaceae bacterium]|nr:hypothetical protein [Sulfurimonadaceae bacterium]
MEITLLIKSIIGLVAVLGILLYFLFAPAKKEKIKKIKKADIIIENGMKTDLASLASVMRRPTSTQKELEEASRLLLKYHGKFHPKMGLRLHPDFSIYHTILIAICRHKNTTKEIILMLDKELTALNPEYKKEINEAVTKGLNSRDA